MRRSTTLAASLLASTALSSLATASDGVVQAQGLSHYGWHDRSPAVPVRDEAFTVRFQALAGDLTGARVRQFVIGTPVREFEASVVGQRGPYEIWEAQLDGRDAPLVTYDIVVEDGGDVDFVGVDGHGEATPSGGAFALDFTSFTHAPRGATPTRDGVVYRVWAPTAPNVFVRGSFNAWGLTNPMTRVGSDYIEHVTISGEGDEYKFYFDATQTWKSDPNARRMVGFENAVVIDPEGYQWQSGPFTPPDFDSMVHYQLHVGSFAGRNDPAGFAPTPSRFIDVEARLDHVEDLNVNVVYLNPVNEWPSFVSGGYNPISYTAIEASYGTPNELKSLIDELHQRGIAVILDIVPNHVDFSNNFLFGFQGPLSPTDNIYFDTPPFDTPWGPQLDFDRADVREYIVESVVQQLEEYRFDGLRVDALSAMIFGPQSFQGREILKEINARSDVRWADKFIVAEEFSDDPFITRPVEFGGLGFEAQYHNGWKNPLRDATFGAAFGNVNVGNIAGAMTKTGELSGSRVWNYFELHDEVWGLSGGERAVQTIDTVFPHDDVFATSRTKLAHGLTLLSKGVPAFVMGTEWLEDDEWEVQKIDWTHKILYAGIIDYYRTLIGLRTTEPALFADAASEIVHLNDSNDVFAVERRAADGKTYVAVANFGTQSWLAPISYRIGLPQAGEWKVVVNSDDLAFRGQGLGQSGLFQSEPIPWDGEQQSIGLQLPPDTLLLLEHAPELITAGTDAVSLASGGSIPLEIDATVDFAGQAYLVLGSLSGTAPGLPLPDGQVIPLVPDAYFQLSLGGANQAPFTNTFGVLDAQGTGQASIDLPSGLPSSLAGASLWHAALLIDPLTVDVLRTTEAVATPLEL